MVYGTPLIGIQDIDSNPTECFLHVSLVRKIKSFKKSKFLSFLQSYVPHYAGKFNQASFRIFHPFENFRIFAHPMKLSLSFNKYRFLLLFFGRVNVLVIG